MQRPWGWGAAWGTGVLQKGFELEGSTKHRRRAFRGTRKLCYLPSEMRSHSSALGRAWYRQRAQHRLVRWKGGCKAPLRPPSDGCNIFKEVKPPPHLQLQLTIAVSTKTLAGRPQ